MQKKLLGVYIPTYNRKAELEECLLSFIPQVRKYNFPIYVSDNGSTDGTEQLLRSMQRKYSGMHYQRNEKNLGYALNLAKVLEMGDTDYVWFFGDDDVIREGAIDTIVEHLNSGAQFLQINTEMYDHSLKEKIGIAMIPVNEDFTYGAKDHDLVLTNCQRKGYAGFMAGIITRRSFLLKELKGLDQSKFADMDFPHTLLFFRSIIGKRGVLIVKPLIKYRASSRAYSAKDIEIWVKGYPETIRGLQGSYSPKVLAAIGKTQNVFAAAYVCKRDHPENAAANRRYILESRKLDYLTKIAALAMLSMPDVLVRGTKGMAKGIYHRIAGNDKQADSNI